MQVMPLMPLAAGDVVRLTGGGRAGAPWLEEPAALARSLHRAGAGGLHVWDLEGLAVGRLQALLDVIDVLMAVPLPVAVRCGSAGLEEMGQVLSRGAARVVVEAGRDDGLALAAARCFGDRALPALEVRRGRVTPCGADAEPDPRLRLRRLAAAGIREALIVDLDRLGEGEDVDIDLARHLAGQGVGLTWAGGGANRRDAAALAAVDGVTAVVTEPGAWLGPRSQPARAGKERA